MQDLMLAQRSRNEVPVTFAHKSSLSSVWSGVGTWGALKVNVTFRGCGRCPDNEKNRDWPWEGREGEGLASLVCKGTGQRWVKKRGKAELRKDKQSRIETSRSDFCKRQEVRRESMGRREVDHHP